MAEAPAPAAPPPAGESRLRSRYRRRSLSRDDANSAVSLAARWRRHTVAVRPRHHNKVEAEAELDGPLPTVFKEVETAKAALVNDTGEAWARFESCVSPHVRTALPPAAWSVLEEAVSGALDAVRLKAGDALTDLAESCKQRARMQLKEQAANFESKLETARRASYVRVENAHAEDSFKLQKAVKEKEQQMLNDDTALQEARQQLGVVTAALEEQIGLRANFEGALAAANKALSSAEHRAADAEAKVHELVEDRARLSVLLDDDRLEELKVTRTEQQRTLGDRLACVQAALVFANEERDEARYALDSVEERARLQLAKQLAEELEPMRAELAASNAKCAMLKGALANLGEDFKASKQRLEEEGREAAARGGAACAQGGAACGAGRLARRALGARSTGRAARARQHGDYAARVRWGSGQAARGGSTSRDQGERRGGCGGEPSQSRVGGRAEEGK